MLTLLTALRRHAALFLFLLTAAALALLARDWLAQHDARLKLESTLTAQQKIVTDSDQRQSARDAQLSQTLSQIAALKKSVQTPQQSAAAINQALQQWIAGIPGRQSLPAPIQIDLPNPSNASADKISTAPAPTPPTPESEISNPKLSSASALSSQQGISQQGNPQQGSGQQGTTASATPQSNTPPPATLRIPQDDLKPLFDAIEDCQSCSAQLSTAQSNLKDERAKSAAIAVQRDAAIKSARGTFWTRLRHNAKWFIIGAAAGAVLARYH
jgi:hypothetical protein